MEQNLDKNKKGKVVTSKEIDFTIKILELLRDSGVSLDRAIQILKESKKALKAKRKERVYSVTVQRLYSKGPEIDDEVLVVNSLELARKIADAISKPMKNILENNKLTLMEKLEKIGEVGEVGRVYDKHKKKLVYEDEDLLNLMKKL